MTAIADETRPVNLWDVHPNTRPFIRQDLDAFWKGYRRDKQQTQPDHIEIIGEKNTVASILRPVASEFGIPLTMARGYSSLPPRYEVFKRYQASGREKLILLIASDFDPDGEEICHSFARSMRDDFGVKDVRAVKVALTQNQVRRLSLVPNMTAKQGSANYRKFADRYGEQVFELEALPATELQRLLHEAVDSVLDTDAYNAEIEAEKADADFLLNARRRVLPLLESRPWMADGRGEPMPTTDTRNRPKAVTFERLCRAYPTLRLLAEEADSYAEEGNEPHFCANRAWYDEHVPPRQPAGSGDPHRRPRREAVRQRAYDAAYMGVYDRLPDCRDCGCFRREDLT